MTTAVVKAPTSNYRLLLLLLFKGILGEPVKW